MNPVDLVFLEDRETRKIVASWPRMFTSEDSQAISFQQLLAIGAIHADGSIDPLAQEYIVAAAWGAIGLEPPEPAPPAVDDIESARYSITVNSRTFNGDLGIDRFVTRSADVRVALQGIVPTLATQALAQHKMSPRPGLAVDLRLQIKGVEYQYSHRF